MHKESDYAHSMTVVLCVSAFFFLNEHGAQLLSWENIILGIEGLLAWHSSPAESVLGP